MSEKTPVIETPVTDPKATTETPPKQEEKAPVTFTAEQQAVLDKLIGDARKDGKSAAERAAKDSQDAAEAERQRNEQEAKGEFETVKQSLIAERDTLKADNDAKTAKIDSYEALAAKRVETVKATIPAEALEDFPADADALEQLTWLDTRSKLVEKLVPATGVTGAPRVPPTPPANGKTPEITKEQQAAIDRQYRRF